MYIYIILGFVYLAKCGRYIYNPNIYIEVCDREMVDGIYYEELQIMVSTTLNIYTFGNNYKKSYPASCMHDSLYH